MRDPYSIRLQSRGAWRWEARRKQPTERALRSSPMQVCPWRTRLLDIRSSPGLRFRVPSAGDCANGEPLLRPRLDREGETDPAADQTIPASVGQSLGEYRSLS